VTDSNKICILYYVHVFSTMTRWLQN